MMRRRVARVRWQRPIGQGPSVFIGREPEIEKFRKAVALDAADEDGGRVSLVMLVGAAGTGKTALMYEFQRLCEARRPSRCGPVIDLRTQPELESMLERIADSFVEDGEDPFRAFRETLRRAENQRAQRKSRLVTGTDIAQQGLTKANELAPGLTTGALRASAEVVSYTARALDRPLGPNAVEQKFIECLLELSRRDDASPVVLLFAYVDRGRASPTVAWIRSRLLPATVTAPITVVVSAESEADVADLERLGKFCVLPLERFSAQDSFAFIERAMGIPRTSRLAEQLVADCDGFPERLERYRVYFRERDPGARKADQIPERAREWAAGGASTLGQLERFTTPAAQRLVVHAAALRWFNAPLLREAAAAAGLGDAADEAVAELLDASRRPPWIGQVGAGWGITVPLRRREFVDECRRLDPAAYREVHERALAYHRMRLGVPDGASEPSLERRDRPDDDASVAELLYHQIALDPDRGLRLIADRVAELIVAGEFEDAAKLADIGPEVPLSRDHSLLLRELRDAAAAGADGAFGLAAASLDRVATMAGVTERLAAAVAYQSGVCAWQLGRSSSEVIAQHRRAEELFSALPPGPETARMRVQNLLWLASHTSNVTDDGVTPLLRRAATLAKSVDDEGLLADVDQIRAQLAKDADEALRYYDRALSRLESPNAPKSPASLLSSRASFLTSRGRHEEARTDYLRALELHQRCEESEWEAGVAVELISLELVAGDAEAAAKWEELAVGRRPKDALLRNRVALAYHRHAIASGDDRDLLERAIEIYDDAVELGGEAVIFANRGDAYARLARLRRMVDDNEGAAEREGLALSDLSRAHQLAPHDVRTAIDLANLQRELGDDPGAAETASAAAEQLVNAIKAYTRGGHGSARRVVPRELRALFDDVVDLPIRGGAVAFVRSCAEAFPRSAELARVLATALRDVYERTRDADDANDALQAFAEAAQLFAAAGEDHREAECELNRAELFAAEKAWSSARTAAERVLELQPDNDAARELTERVQRLAQRDEWGGAEGDTLFDPPVRVWVAEDLLPFVDPAQSGDSTLFDETLPAMRDAIRLRTGVYVPGVSVRGDPELAQGSIQFELHNVARWGVMVEGERLAGVDEDVCATVGVSGSQATRPWDGGPATWVTAADAELLERARIPVWDVPGVIAGTAQMALEHELADFVGVEQAVWIAEERGWAVQEASPLDLADVVRRLVDAGVGLDVSDEVVARLLSCSPRELEEEIAALATTAEPLPPPDALEYAQRGARTGVDGLVATVRIHVPAGADTLGLDEDLTAVVQRLCDTQSLPAPSVAVTEDPTLGPSTFAVDVDGVTRFQGAVPTRIDWDRAHPAAGPDGRTGIFPCTGFGVRTVVGRAVEQVLWDDPGLLLTPLAAAVLVGGAVGGEVPQETVDSLACALREVANRRVPLPGAALAEALRLVADHGVPGRDRARVERHDRSPDRTIPDGLPLGIRDAVQVELDQPVASLRVRVHVRHAYPSDLRVRLEAPDGTSAVLADRSSPTSTDLRIEATPATNPALGVFVDRDAAGEWSLHVADLDEGAGGTLTAWTLELFAAGDGGEATRVSSDAERARSHVIRVERLTRALRPFEVSVRLGASLHEAVQTEADRHDETASTPLDGLLHTVALSPQPPVWKQADDLRPWDFEVVVNGLPRARGTIPPDSVFLPFGDDGAVAIDPWSCVPGAWTDAGAVTGGDALHPREWLTAQLARTLYDEISELCDLGWTERLLVLVDDWFPTLAKTIRDRYGLEQTAYALGRLVSQNYSIRNLRAWEALLARAAETKRAAEFDAAAPAGLSVAQFPGALAEFVAHELRETRWNGPPLAAIELDGAVADAVEAAVATGPPPEPVYSYPAGPLLETLDELLREGAPELLVTRRSIRRHVRRLLRAQFPTVRVIAEEHLDPRSPVVVTHRLALPDALSVPHEDGGASAG